MNVNGIPSKQPLIRAGHVRREDLKADEVEEMRALLECHFEGVDRGQFLRDLEDKSHVLRIWKDGRLAGFSSLLAFRDEFAGEPCNILYSGDTIVSPDCWTSPVLARGWIAMVRNIISQMPDGRCLWLLLSAGFRTYRLLPVFWREFWPRHDVEMPDEIRGLRDEIASRRFGANYDAAGGVVRFDLPHRLRGFLAQVPDGRDQDPHVAYFLGCNSGWRNGDELVCLAEIEDGNLTAAGRRMIRGLDG